MIQCNFDVNDALLRKDYLAEVLPSALERLEEQSLPKWGVMTAQQMIEHLLSVFEVSTGKIFVALQTPEHLLPRVKRFLYDNRPTPMGVKNPILGDAAQPIRFRTFDLAREAVLGSTRDFHTHFITNGHAEYVHPLFGSLGFEEWERVHYKHCFHHLLQFGLIKETTSEYVVTNNTNPINPQNQA